MTADCPLRLSASCPQSPYTEDDERREQRVLALAPVWTSPRVRAAGSSPSTRWETPAWRSCPRGPGLPPTGKRQAGVRRPECHLLEDELQHGDQSDPAARTGTGRGGVRKEASAAGPKRIRQPAIACASLLSIWMTRMTKAVASLAASAEVIWRATRTSISAADSIAEPRAIV